MHQFSNLFDKVIHRSEARPPNSRKLLWACFKGDVVQVRELLDSGADPNSQSTHGDIEAWSMPHMPCPMSGLSLATIKGYYNIVQLLLSCRNINPNLKDFGGQTALNLAMANKHYDVASLLLASKDVETSVSDSRNLTPLWYAVMDNRRDIVDMLLWRPEVDIYMSNRYYESPVVYAINHGMVDIVEAFIESGKFDLRRRCSRGFSMMHYAALSCDAALIRMMLKARDLDANKQTSALSVIDMDDSNVLSMLLALRDLDELRPDHPDFIPLMYAVKMGDIRMVKALLERGADPDAVSLDGETILMLACQGPHMEIVKMLLKTGRVNVTRQSNEGGTALRYAAGGGDVTILHMLLRTGKLDVNFKDSDQNTALHVACLHEQAAAVEYLLARDDVDVEAKDFLGREPIMIALADDLKGRIVIKFLRSERFAFFGIDARHTPAIAMALARGRDLNTVLAVMINRERDEERKKGLQFLSAINQEVQQENWEEARRLMLKARSEWVRQVLGKAAGQLVNH